MPHFDTTRRAYWLLNLLLIFSLVSGCAGQASGRALPTETGMPAVAAEPAISTPVATALPAVTQTPEAAEPRLWISPDLPEAFRAALKLPAGIQTTSSREAANLWLDVSRNNTAGSEPSAPSAHWVYALVAPFPTIVDQISQAELEALWLGKTTVKTQTTLLVAPETRAVFERLWGKAAAGTVKTIAQEALLDTAWKAVPTPPRATAALVTATPRVTSTPAPTVIPSAPVLAIIPFEQIEPRWKVISVDGKSPLEKGFKPEAYPLAVPIMLQADAGRPVRQAALQALQKSLVLPTNFDPDKLTVLVMTGTTAISRHIGERMETKGMTYPDQDIHDWLAGADLTHISNEVSFYKNCPRPGPDRADMRFCSSPKYIQLLEDAGTDIVELTGNHNLDWGIQPFLDSLEMYRQRGWKTYGGGATLDEAKKPLLVEHNGNKLAFIGCSPAGPAAVWATQYTPGSAPCNMVKLEQQVRQLRATGYLPIVTYQAVETDTYLPAPAQGTPDFRRMARAGAVIVSGSQSHVPQTMTFVNGSFVHYGLGNLFFDQMNPIETRQEFIDQHVFYNGRYLGVHLYTALLEDYSRPRPMTAGERSDFLQKIFSLCNWNEN